MNDSDIVNRLKRIDEYQNKISEIIFDIRDSDHPKAIEIADALYEQCWFPASAEHVCIDFLNPARWALQQMGKHLGGIVSRRQAAKRNISVAD